MFIGRVKDWSDLDALIAKYNVRCCLISPQPEPHLVQKWVKSAGYRIVQQVIYPNDGISEPDWDRDGQRVTVDRTFALNSALRGDQGRVVVDPARGSGCRQRGLLRPDEGADPGPGHGRRHGALPLGGDRPLGALPPRPGV